ncbi:hypothetical protein PYJP_07210 [Pyrofollis japonicus]|uniref:ribbon-helix-helix protein, CopG family n=1 Tax=Pyrofollis japonicus TaxID=3060460 RepID=UPI00295A7E7C|nr:ribbon-helix-helix protein, CopG family [Pyrofollis japonicus]BEP17369.1 hypothetical protein PYJP_07210 [Pyrofollis japonicus]
MAFLLETYMYTGAYTCGLGGAWGMGSRVVPVRLDEELLELVDELVRLGLYGSRSEALRDLIRIGARHVLRARVVSEAVGKLFELEREEGDIPVRLRGALEQLLSERERL